LTLAGCFAASFEATSGDAGARPGLVSNFAARDSSPHLTNRRAALLRVSLALDLGLDDNEVEEVDNAYKDNSLFH
jgi:hypothetical protein